MTQLDGGHRLALETLPQVLVVGVLRPDHLDHPVDLEQQVADLVDRAHATLADLLNQLVLVLEEVLGEAQNAVFLSSSKAHPSTPKSRSQGLPTRQGNAPGPSAGSTNGMGAMHLTIRDGSGRSGLSWGLRSTEAPAAVVFLHRLGYRAVVESRAEPRGSAAASRRRPAVLGSEEEVNARKSRFWLVPALVLACLLVQPVGVASQCMVMSTPTGTLSAGMIITALKVLSTAANCSLTMTMAASCNPVGPSVTASLFASAHTSTTATMSVSCGWNCGCGAVTIDGTDGLPVELMDFGIEDEETPDNTSDTGGT